MTDSTALEERLMSRLEELGISTTTHRHPPVRTVDEAKALRGSLSGTHIKNLFIRDKKRTMWLVTVREDLAVDLKALRKQLEAKGNLSFGSAELLSEALGIAPGAVTPFAVMNDTEGRVTMVMERALADAETINAHPLHNEATTTISASDLIRFLESCDHPPTLIDFDSL
jgi:Ala-tRNA(Pro) deacylase